MTAESRSDASEAQGKAENATRSLQVPRRRGVTDPGWYLGSAQLPWSARTSHKRRLLSLHRQRGANRKAGLLGAQHAPPAAKTFAQRKHH